MWEHYAGSALQAISLGLVVLTTTGGASLGTAKHSSEIAANPGWRIEVAHA